MRTREILYMLPVLNFTSDSVCSRSTVVLRITYMERGKKKILLLAAWSDDPSYSKGIAGKIFAKRKGEPALKKLKDAAKKQENKKSAADPKAPASAKPSMMMEKKAKTTTAAKSAAGLMAKSKLVSTKKASMGVDCTMKGPDAGVEVTDTADVQWICTEMTKTETGTTNELPFRGLLNYKKNLATPRNAIKLHTLADGEEAGNASTPVVNYRFVECKEPDIDIMSCTVGQICDACQKATDKCPDTPTTEEQMGPDASGEGGLLKCT